MNLHDIAYSCRKVPRIKKFLKDTYQFVGNIISDKKTVGNIIQISSDDKEHMFGYYDKCPWNDEQKKMIYMEVEEANKTPDSNKEVGIVLKNLETGEEKIIEHTRAWNVQQGCMLQWLGPDFHSKILYNDEISGMLKTVILDMETKEKRILDLPVYDVTKDGKLGLGLDFSRLHRLRPRIWLL